MIIAFLIFFSIAVLALCTIGFVNICRMHMPAAEIVKGGVLCSISILFSILLWIANI